MSEHRSARLSPGRKKKFISGEGIAPYAFLLPGFSIFLLCIIIPLIQAAQMSFFEWNIRGLSESTFIGLDNYLHALTDSQFWLSLTNSAVYMVFTVPPQIILGLLIAMLLNRHAPAKSVFRALFYLPVVTSWVVVSLLFKYLFADLGLINYIFSSDISWLSDRWSAMLAISALGVWKGIGWSMMIFLAALQGVPVSLEEAATMDGAGRWSRFRVVTLPAIWPAALFVLVMLVIGGFNVFTSVVLMTGGGPAGQTEVLLTYMYRTAFDNLDFGYSSAQAMFLVVMLFVFSFLQMRVLRGPQ